MPPVAKHWCPNCEVKVRVSLAHARFAWIMRLLQSWQGAVGTLE